MRIGFLVMVNTHFRLLAPLIDETLHRKHDVFVIRTVNFYQGGVKKYLNVSLEDVPSFSNGMPFIVSYSDEIEFARSIQDNRIDVVVSVDFHQFHVRLREIARTYHTKWVSLQYALDTLASSGLIDSPDLYFFYNKIWYDLARTYSNGKIVGDNVRYCGFPELDQKKIIDPVQVRKEWGIPENRPVVLYLSFQYFMQDNWLYSRYIFTQKNLLMKLVACLRHPKYVYHLIKGYNNENVFNAIKTFCDRNGAFLLINGRQKSPIPPYVVGDKTLTDISFYPADILKCLSISNICFNFWSLVVTECAGMGVPNVCIAPDTNDIFAKTHNPSSNYMTFKHVLRSCPDLFDTNGVTRLMTVPDIISKLPSMKLEDFSLNPNSIASYIQKFLLAVDGNSSELILSEIEKLTPLYNDNKITRRKRTQEL